MREKKGGLVMKMPWRLGVDHNDRRILSGGGLVFRAWQSFLDHLRRSFQVFVA